MNTNDQDEAARLNAERMQQEQAERDFVAAREQLAAEDAAERPSAPSPDTRTPLEISQERWQQAEQAENGAKSNPDAELTADAIQLNPYNVLYMRISDPALFPQALEVGEQLLKESGEAWKAHGFNGDGFLADDASQFVHDLDERMNGLNAPDHKEAGERLNASAEQPEALTLEAINRDPMNAVNLAIPEDADLYLMHRIEKAAEQVSEDANERMESIDDREAFSEQDAIRTAALARQTEARTLLDQMTRDEVAPDHTPEPDGTGKPDQPEAMTLEAIQRDPWNAVNLPIPDNADCELLEVIEGTAGKLADATAAALSHIEEAHQMGAPVPSGAQEAAEAGYMAATTRAMEAEEALEELACLTQGDGERQAPQIDAADSFRMGADATTNTEQGQKDRDLAARILALEELTGNEDSKGHHAFIAGQQGYGERIANADTPDMREALQAGKFAQAQTYAADLCEQGQIQHGLEGRFEEAALLMQESHIRREIAEGIAPGGPENNPPDRGDDAGKDTGNIADAMTAAAAEALGPKTRVAFIVDGPSGEQQQGERPDPNVINGEPGKGDYAALREETAAIGENDERAKVADYGLNIRAVMEVAPEGTYIASRPQASYAAQETDYENGPSRPGMAAFVALAATQDAASDAGAAEETRIAEASEKAKREDTSGAKDAELGTTTSEAAKEATARPLSRAERAEQEAAEYAAEAGREQEGGHAMAAGGRGGR
jgi:hypothetical protein